MIHLSLETRSSGSVVSTVNFNSGGYKLLDGFYPKSGNLNKQLTESFDISIKASSNSDLETKVRAVELALAFAREHQSGPDGVWILFSPKDTTLTEWQTRVTGGAVQHNPDLNKRWKDLKAQVQVILERDPYWESKTETTLALTNRGTTGGSSADIVNHQDAGATDDLYIEIPADQVTGVISTPAIIEYKNTVNDAVLVDNLIVGHFAASGTISPPAAASLIMEGDVTADANCSGGKYKALTWADALENQLLSWTKASGDFQQRNYKMIARLRDVVAYTDLWLKVKLLSGSTVLTETRWTLVTAGKSLVSIGTLQIPPFRFGSILDLGNLTVAIYEKQAAGSGTINLDYLAAIPLDGWRKYSAITGLAYNETILDDPVDEILVTKYSTNYKVTHKIEEGDPIMLQPGVKNVLYFLHDTTTGTAPIARTANVVVKCHPRRLTV